jgi:hypothetical protein
LGCRKPVAPRVRIGEDEPQEGWEPCRPATHEAPVERPKARRAATRRRREEWSGLHRARRSKPESPVPHVAQKAKLESLWPRVAWEKELKSSGPCNAGGQTAWRPGLTVSLYNVGGQIAWWWSRDVIDGADGQTA